MAAVISVLHKGTETMVRLFKLMTTDDATQYFQETFNSFMRNIQLDVVQKRSVSGFMLGSGQVKQGKYPIHGVNV